MPVVKLASLNIGFTDAVATQENSDCLHAVLTQNQKWKTTTTNAQDLAESMKVYIKGQMASFEKVSSDWHYMIWIFSLLFLLLCVVLPEMQVEDACTIHHIN